uniref:Interferon-induced protein 44-like n=1 Tax=Stegastes partitus TaxID=144197 RepID=A0A3B5BAG9_9TELE
IFIFFIFNLHHDGIQQLRILLCGPCGAGKSSFINSVDSALQGRMTGRATGYSGLIGTFYPFALSDIMGLERDTGRGVRVEDIKLAMKGHVRDGYKFNPNAALSDQDNGYNNNPSPNDKVHVLVCVVSAYALNLIPPETMTKMREVQLAARALRIPQLAVLTRIDEVCPEVNKDIKNVYKSIYVKKQVHEVSGFFLESTRLD